MTPRIIGRGAAQRRNPARGYRKGPAGSEVSLPGLPHDRCHQPWGYERKAGIERGQYIGASVERHEMYATFSHEKGATP